MKDASTEISTLRANAEELKAQSTLTKGQLANTQQNIEGLLIETKNRLTTSEKAIAALRLINPEEITRKLEVINRPDIAAVTDIASARRDICYIARQVADLYVALPPSIPDTSGNDENLRAAVVALQKGLAELEVLHSKRAMRLQSATLQVMPEPLSNDTSKPTE